MASLVSFRCIARQPFQFIRGEKDSRIGSRGMGLEDLLIEEFLFEEFLLEEFLLDVLD